MEGGFHLRERQEAVRERGERVVGEEERAGSGAFHRSVRYAMSGTVLASYTIGLCRFSAVSGTDFVSYAIVLYQTILGQYWTSHSACIGR